MNEQERLMALMQAENMNAKDFAMEVGISPATMSNLINGRNKPSLEVMQKVLARFRMVNPQWLIVGNGSMYLEKSNSQSDKPEVVTDGTAAESAPYVSTPVAKAKTVQQPAKPDAAAKEVVKVLVIYNDGTFDELVPKYQ